MRWRTFPAYLVRLAGFSFAKLEILRCSRLAQLADELDRLRDRRETAGVAFDTALAQERFADYPALDDADVRKQFSRHVKQARSFARRLELSEAPRNALLAITEMAPKMAALTNDLLLANAGWLAADSEYRETHRAELERVRIALRGLYEDPRLREAVFLESPDAHQRIEQLLASPLTRNVRARQRERLAMMYAQRFCAKNDTNSLCGPHGVGYFSQDDAAADLDAGCIELLVQDARRDTYVSHWAAQALLDAAVHRAASDTIVTYRLHPMARMDGKSISWCAMSQDGTVSRRRYARSDVPESAIPILRELGRPRTHKELFALAASLGLDADELDAFVGQLVQVGVLLKGPLLPTGLFRPLLAVASELESWPASEARTWGLDQVAGLQDLVDHFSRAPLAQRIDLLPRIEALFQEATGSAAQRGEGMHYADRSVFHEDRYVETASHFGAARRAIEHTLPPLIAVLTLPLALGRERTREWFASRFGQGHHVPAIDVHRAFDDDRVLEQPAATPLADQLRLAMLNVRNAISRAVAAGDGATAQLSVEELRDALAHLPEPRHSGYVSADVMLRCLPDGRAGLVVAEVHGFCWLPTCLLDVLPEHERERVLAMMRDAVHTMSHGASAVECMFTHTQATDRRFPLAERDLQFLVPSDRAGALDFSALTMRLHEDLLEFWNGDEEISPLVAYNRYTFLHHTSRVAPLFDDQMDRFFPDELLPPELRTHDVPRISVDGVVFQRRTWRRSIEEFRALLGAVDDAGLFQRAQALRRQLGCESRVFVSISGEPKPIYFDFHNPLLLEALTNLLERQKAGGTVKISEMLPGPEELVARGPDGARTSELRIGLLRA